jgi:hypothetical protein
MQTDAKYGKRPCGQRNFENLQHILAKFSVTAVDG